MNLAGPAPPHRRASDDPRALSPLGIDADARVIKATISGRLDRAPRGPRLVRDVHRRRRSRAAAAQELGDRADFVAGVALKRGGGRPLARSRANELSLAAVGRKMKLRNQLSLVWGAAVVLLLLVLLAQRSSADASARGVAAAQRARGLGGSLPSRSSPRRCGPTRSGGTTRRGSGLRTRWRRRGERWSGSSTSSRARWTRRARRAARARSSCARWTTGARAATRRRLERAPRRERAAAPQSRRGDLAGSAARIVGDLAGAAAAPEDEIVAQTLAQVRRPIRCESRSWRRSLRPPFSSSR